MTASALTVDDWLAMLGVARDTIVEHADELGGLDRAIGDGDHGTSMRRAMDLVAAALETDGTQTVGGLFDAAGKAIIRVDGGATGPLWAAFFSGMAMDAMSAEALDAAGVADALSNGLAKLETRTKARVGDKTLVDAVTPAAAAARQTASTGQDAVAVLAAAAAAAMQGAAATEPLQAKFGRSKHQGERAIGHRDPGAESMALILGAFAGEAARRYPNAGRPTNA